MLFCVDEWWWWWWWSTKCNIDTVVSPDDGHVVAQNMYRKAVNVLRKIVQQVGFISHIIQGRTVNKTNLLTRSMVQSPSWAANWFAASQEIPRISQNPTVHYRTHNRPSPVSVLGHPNPVHIPISHRSVPILSTHLHLGLPTGRLPSSFPTKTLYTPLSSPIRATCPAHLILDVGWAVQII